MPTLREVLERFGLLEEAKRDAKQRYEEKTLNKLLGIEFEEVLDEVGKFWHGFIAFLPLNIRIIFHVKKEDHGRARVSARLVRTTSCYILVILDYVQKRMYVYVWDIPR